LLKYQRNLKNYMYLPEMAIGIGHSSFSYN